MSRPEKSRRHAPEPAVTPALTYPVRLNRYLALRGLATRRMADALITEGKVLLNGRPATLGDKVLSAADTVVVAPSVLAATRAHIYLAYYKPRGIITHSPQRGERAITDVCGVEGVFPVGRLDKDSEGLIILTDDGRVTERLLHPRFVHEKEYIVTVRGTVSAETPRRMMAGIRDDGERLTAARVDMLSPRQLRIVLTEGKKHEIRRLCTACDLAVTRLVRIRIMDVRLGSLAPGESRPLRGLARAQFLRALGLGGESV